MATRQFESLQRASLARLARLIPPECPLRVLRAEPSGFRAETLDRMHAKVGRFEVVAAWIQGFVIGWTRP
jgi:hypothetical protein